MINRNVDQFFQRVKIFERTVNLDILEDNLHDSIAVYGDSFLTDVSPVSNQARYCFCSDTVAITVFKACFKFRGVSRCISTIFSNPVHLGKC